MIGQPTREVVNRKLAHVDYEYVGLVEDRANQCEADMTGVFSHYHCYRRVSTELNYLYVCVVSASFTRLLFDACAVRKLRIYLT